MANFFEIQSPQYVSSFSPLNLDVIGKGMEQWQTRADKSSAMLGDMYSRLNDIDTYDPMVKDQVMEQLRGASDQILTDAGGDYSKAATNVLRLAQMAKQDPFWKLNDAKVKAVQDQERLIAGMKANGKTPYIFKDASTLQLLDKDKNYIDKANINYDIIPEPDTDTKIRGLWKDYLQNEGREWLAKSDVLGKLLLRSWHGIKDTQVEKDLNTVIESFKDSDEYKAFERIAKHENPNLSQEDFDAQIKKNITEIGMAMTGYTTNLQYMDDPNYVAGGGGGDPNSNQLTESTGFWASSKGFDKYDLSDILNQKEGGTDNILKGQVLSYIMADENLKKSVDTYIRQVKSTITTFLKDGKLSADLVADKVTIQKILEGEQLNHEDFSKLDQELKDISYDLGPKIKGRPMGLGRTPQLEPTETDKFVASTLNAVNLQLKSIYSTMESRLQTMKDNEDDFMTPTYGTHLATGDNQASTRLTKGVQGVLDRIDSKLLFNENTKKYLSEEGFAGKDLTWKSIIPDPFSNTLKVRVDIKVKDKPDLVDQIITISNNVEAGHIIAEFDKETGGALSNAMNDIYFVDRSNGNLIDKKTSEVISLNAGYKAKRSSIKEGNTLVGVEYTVEKSDGNSITYQEHYNNMYNKLKLDDSAAAEEYRKVVENSKTYKDNINKPFRFSNTSEIAFYYGKRK